METHPRLQRAAGPFLYPRKLHKVTLRLRRVLMAQLTGCAIAKHQNAYSSDEPRADFMKRFARLRHEG